MKNDIFSKKIELQRQRYASNQKKIVKKLKLQKLFEKFMQKLKNKKKFENVIDRIINCDELHNLFERKSVE